VTGQPVRRIARPSAKRLSQVLFLDHALRINDVRLAFTLYGQCREDASLHAWRGERECHDRVLNPLAVQPWLPVRPDAYLEIQAGGKVVSLFLEVDLGTTPARRFAQKVQGYIAYRMTGRYQARYGQATFRVLTVTTTARRLASLKKATEKVGGRRMFWFTTFDQVTPQTVLGPVWQVAGEAGQVALLPASQTTGALPPAGQSGAVQRSASQPAADPPLGGSLDTPVRSTS
jgi:hypothetical protein